MNDSPVLVQREGTVVTLTMHTPGKLNAFTLAMRNRLVELFTELNADPTCRAIILTGADGNFSAGGDMQSFREQGIAACRARLKAGSSPLMRAMIGGSTPIIAAVEGYAYGAGMALAAASDYVVAAVNSKFSCAFIRVAFIPDTGLLWSLPRRIGLGRAKRLMILGTSIDGLEAQRIGLVEETAPAGAALAAAQEIAGRFAEAPPLATEFIKSALAEDLEPMLRREIDLQSVLLFTADHEEGKRAFAEKRKPSFEGK